MMCQGLLQRLLVLVMLATAMVAATPAAAQFSDSYNFIKAVKDRDVNKAIELADQQQGRHG